MKTTTHKGFTLIELLVVVAIIGILATIVLAALGNARIKAKDSAVMSELSQVRTAAELTYGGNFTTFCDDTGSVYEKFTNDIILKGGQIDSCDQASDSYRIIATLPSALASSTTTAYAAGEDGFCINSLGTAQKVFTGDVYDYAAPACTSGEASVVRNYFWGCWFGNALCMMSALPGETLASPPSAPVERCDSKSIPDCGIVLK